MSFFLLFFNGFQFFLFFRFEMRIFFCEFVSTENVVVKMFNDKLSTVKLGQIQLSVDQTHIEIFSKFCI